MASTTSSTTKTNNRGGTTGEGIRTAPTLDPSSPFYDLVPQKEPWERIHHRIPHSTYEVLQAVAAIKRVAVTVLAREVLVEWAEEQEKLLQQELAEQKKGKR